MIKRHYAFLAFGLLLLAGCGPSESPKGKPEDPVAKQAAEKMAANVRMLVNPDRNTAEFLQQLRENIKLANGVLIIEDPLGIGISVVPLTSPWVIQCGAGITVTFGSAVSGDGASVRNETEIRLSFAVIPKERCKEIAPLIGKEIQAILSGG